MKKPVVSLTHQMDTSRNSSNMYGVIGADIVDSTDTMISIYATLNPPLAKPQPKEDQMVTREEKYLVTYAKDWVKKLNALPQCAKRRLEKLGEKLIRLGSKYLQWIWRENRGLLRDISIPRIPRLVSDPMKLLWSVLSL